MKHTKETAFARAIELGYDGAYARIMAELTAGKTEKQIESESADSTQNCLRRLKYERAAALKTNPSRKRRIAAAARKRNL